MLGGLAGWKKKKVKTELSGIVYPLTLPKDASPTQIHEKLNVFLKLNTTTLKVRWRTP